MPNKLDDLVLLRTIDKSSMADYIAELPQQLETGLKIASQKKLPVAYLKLSKAVLMGMGGSATAADLLLAQPLENFKKPLLLLRENEIPGWVDTKTLVVLISHSGQTKETLSAFKQAASREAKIIVISERGSLEELGSLENAQVYDYDTQAAPRASLGFQLGILVGIFNQLDFFPKIDLSAASELLKNINQELQPASLTEKNLAKHLAFKLFDHEPVMLAGGILSAVGRRFKNQLNENAKTYGACETMPEAMHNSLEGLSFPTRGHDDNFYVLLRSVFDNQYVLAGLEHWMQVLDEEKIEYELLEGQGNDLWSQNLSLVALADWASFYLAILNNLDPTPVPRIEKFK
ncbi:MAG TPA: SIS domain-containing protein [bacterium]|nr:SIS domain-containing protein [bacterium]